MAHTQKYKLDKAKKEGLDEGEKKKSEIMAKKMIDRGEPIEKIIEYTELTKDEAENL